MTIADLKNTSGFGGADEIRFIGCCGAYCKTCQPLNLGHCRGCKLGYDDGKRDLARAKCRIKVCCFGTRKQETCAVCPEYDDCDILAEFHRKKSQEYKKYRESLEFIRSKGYPEFVKRAKEWKRACGKL